MFHIPLRQWGIASSKTERYEDKLSSLSNEELIEIFKEGIQRFGAKKLNYIENATGIERIMIAHQPDGFYRWIGAVDVLRERQFDSSFISFYGSNYVEKLTGILEPKTLWEKLKRLYYRNSHNFSKFPMIVENFK